MDDQSEIYLDRFRGRFPDVTLRVWGDPQAGVDPVEFGPEVIFSWKCERIPPAIQKTIISHPTVSWVHVAGAGFEHLRPFPEHMVVTNSAGICSAFMAETVMGAMLMWNFGFPELLQQQRQREWKPKPWASLSTKTILIVGLGNIGRAVASHAKSFGMQVIGIRNHPAAVAGVDEILPADALHDALPRADYVCLHVPLTDRTRSLFGEEEFDLMKREAVMINTARGGVVDERALADALTTGRIAGAYFDVFENEPLPRDSDLWALPNFVISPHMSDLVVDWRHRFADFFMGNLKRWQQGKTLLNVVDTRRGY